MWKRRKRGVGEGKERGGEGRTGKGGGSGEEGKRYERKKAMGRKSGGGGEVMKSFVSSSLR